MICSECKQLQERLNATTDLVREIAKRKPESLGTLRDLKRARDGRNKVWRQFIQHLKAHARALSLRADQKCKIVVMPVGVEKLAFRPK
jgi:hypothetical protein